MSKIKLWKILESVSLPLHDVLARHRSTFSERLVPPKCMTERYSKKPPSELLLHLFTLSYYLFLYCSSQALCTILYFFLYLYSFYFDGLTSSIIYFVLFFIFSYVLFIYLFILLCLQGETVMKQSPPAINEVFWIWIWIWNPPSRLIKSWSPSFFLIFYGHVCSIKVTFIPCKTILPGSSWGFLFFFT